MPDHGDKLMVVVAFMMAIMPHIICWNQVGTSWWNEKKEKMDDGW
jgi:hypothetical protein